MKRDIQSIQEIAIKALAIIGLLAIFTVGSFATISLVRYAGPAFSYLATAAVSLSSVFIPAENENIVLTTDITKVISGKTITFSWKNTDKDKAGSYSIFYPCLDGFYIEATTEARGKETVFCNSQFSFINTNNTLTLTPFSSKNKYVDMPVTLSFTLNGENEISENETVTLTVEKDETVNSIISSPTTSNTKITPLTPVKTNPIPGTKTDKVYTIPSTTVNTVDNPNGKADLKVSVIEVGVVDKISGSFVKLDTLRRSDRIGVRFAVENIGTKSSGEWRFNGILPTYPPHTFYSDSQQSLKPGDRIEFTIGFDQSIAGSQNVRFVIDPQSVVTEILEDNNSTTVNINVL